MEETNNTIYLTKEGLKKLEKDLQILKKDREKKKKEDASVLSPQAGDSEFTNFQQDLNLLESRIEELENILKNYILIKKPLKNKRNQVCIGSTVIVEVDNQEDEFTIVGSLEANPVFGKISNESPVGRSLLGKKEGEEAVVQSAVVTTYKIKKIIYKS
jgi:transcription elongation factor GreA